MLTILSPCILPVLPFVFARAGRSFSRSTLPLLIGMAVAFALIGTLAVAGGNWAITANRWGRWVALVVMAFFGFTLLFPAIADHLTRPLVTLGGKLTQRESGESPGSSLLLGSAIGLLWAPCAGPILGLIFAGAALQENPSQAALLLLAYAVGAATSLSLALTAGGRLAAPLRRSLGASALIRRIGGAAVLLSVLLIALGIDTQVLSRWSVGSTTRMEEQLLRLAPGTDSGNPGTPVPGSSLPSYGPMPPLEDGSTWFNSLPLLVDSLKGKVVVVDFWTYSCINCLRSIPYVRAWAQKYRDHGVVVIGIHTPEFAFERVPANVERAISTLRIEYPVVLDNDWQLWRAFENRYWPAHYFIDVEGRIRYRHFGEGDYDKSEAVIQQLLKEAGNADVPTGIVTPQFAAAEAPASAIMDRSPETWLGYTRAANFASGEIRRVVATKYSVPDSLARDHWGLIGEWSIMSERAVLRQPDGKIQFRFHARDLHLVLGVPEGTPIRFRVTLDGEAPGDSHGADIDAEGYGTVTEQRLYQLIRQTDSVLDRTFEIEFFGPGVEAWAFTFG